MGLGWGRARGGVKAQGWGERWGHGSAGGARGGAGPAGAGSQLRGAGPGPRGGVEGGRGACGPPGPARSPRPLSGFPRAGYSPHGAYAQSKLALVLFTYQLQGLLAAQGSPVTANAVDPGVVNTDLYKHVFWGTRFIRQLLGWSFFKVSPPHVPRSPPCLSPARSPSCPHSARCLRLSGGHPSWPQWLCPQGLPVTRGQACHLSPALAVSCLPGRRVGRVRDEVRPAPCTASRGPPGTGWGTWRPAEAPPSGRAGLPVVGRRAGHGFDSQRPGGRVAVGRET